MPEDFHLDWSVLLPRYEMEMRHVRRFHKHISTFTAAVTTHNGTSFPRRSINNFNSTNKLLPTSIQVEAEIAKILSLRIFLFAAIKHRTQRSWNNIVQIFPAIGTKRTCLCIVPIITQLLAVRRHHNKLYDRWVQAHAHKPLIETLFSLLKREGLSESNLCRKPDLECVGGLRCHISFTIWIYDRVENNICNYIGRIYFKEMLPVTFQIILNMRNFLRAQWNKKVMELFICQISQKLN